MSRNALIISILLGATLLVAGVRALLQEQTSSAASPITPPEPKPVPATPFDPPPVASNSSLHEALQQEIAAREQLALTVTRLEQELRDVKAQLGGGNVPRAAAPDAPPAETPPAPPRRVRDTATRFDDTAMLAAGIDPLEVKQIRDRFEQIELDRLYLKDRAQREGWSGTVRYSNEVGKIEERRREIRNSVSETTYDAYLYSSGETNRVLIRELLQGSPAAAAGLHVGDTVLRYADKRVYSANELQNETKKGRAGESVPMVIERDGQSQTVYIPRGPLGVYLDTESRKP